MKKIKLLTSVILFCSVTLLTSTASAHVLITDTTKKHGAVLHIAPDDNPVAKKPSTLFFDTQDTLLNPSSTISVAITKTGDSRPINLNAKRDGSLITTDYTFPSQGVYSVRYEISTPDGQLVFTDSLRVSNGATNTLLSRSSYRWAEGILFASGALITLLLIIIWNRKESIASHSTF